MDTFLERLYSGPGLGEPKAKTADIVYEDNGQENVLGKYLAPVVDTLYRMMPEDLGRYPLLNNVNVRLEKLPTYWRPYLELAKGKIRVCWKLAGKVFGYYDPVEDRIGIDPVVIRELGDPERDLLNRHMNDIPTIERVAGEELIHRDQRESGSMSRYMRKYGNMAREYIEGAAASLSDKYFGKTGIYESWKSKFRDLVGSVGLRRAYAGAF